MKILIVTVLIAAALAGCTGEADNRSPVNGAGPATPAPTVTPSPTATPTPEDRTDDDTADFTGTAGIVDKRYPDIKAPGLMTAVRTARHGNYDRVVFEFAGPEMPSYHVEYIDKPVRSCGSGDVVPLAGDAWLEVRFTDANAHTPEGKATVEDRERSPNLPIVRDLKITCDFESEVTWVMGVSSPNRYRVLELKQPTRLVVDIKH